MFGDDDGIAETKKEGKANGSALFAISFFHNS